MARPRIEGMDERIIESFISRQIYSSHKEVIHSALMALVKQQQIKEAAQRAEEPLYDDSTYASQLETLETEESNESVGNLARQAATR